MNTLQITPSLLKTLPEKLRDVSRQYSEAMSSLGKIFQIYDDAASLSEKLELSYLHIKEAKTLEEKVELSTISISDAEKGLLIQVCVKVILDNKELKERNEIYENLLLQLQGI